MKSDFEVRHFLGFSAAIFIAVVIVNFLGLGVLSYLKEHPLTTSDATDSVVIEKNDVGLREKISADEIAARPERKILLLGTSVVLGGHVQASETFSSLLMKKLNTDGAEKVLVLNGGFDGQEIYREFDWLIKNVDRLKIDEVIWFPHRNDFIRNADLNEKKNQQAAASRPMAQAEMSTWEKVAISLQSCVEFYKQLAERLFMTRARMQENLPGSAHNAYYTQGLRDSLDKNVAADLADAIRSTHEAMTRRHIRFRAAFVPTADFHRHFGWANAQAFLELKMILDENHVPSAEFFTPLEPYRDQRIFIDYTHFNKRGHEIFSDLLASWLETNK